MTCRSSGTSFVSRRRASIADLAGARGQAADRRLLRCAARIRVCRQTALVHFGNEENVRATMQHPAHTAGSDGILVGERPHPRGWGTFARYLAVYVRELGRARPERMRAPHDVAAGAAPAVSPTGPAPGHGGGHHGLRPRDRPGSPRPTRTRGGSPRASRYVAVNGELCSTAASTRARRRVAPYVAARVSGRGRAPRGRGQRARRRHAVVVEVGRGRRRPPRATPASRRGSRRSRSRGPGRSARPAGRRRAAASVGVRSRATRAGSAA